MPQEFWSNAIYSVTPTILVGLLFWFALRAIIHSDRNERRAYAKIEADERARWSVENGVSGSTAPAPNDPAASTREPRA